MTSPVRIWRESETRYQYLGKTGKILSLTKIQTPVAGFEKYLPYFVAVIQLEDGKKITGQIVVQSSTPKGGQAKFKVQSGDKVVGVLRRLKESSEKGLIEYGVKWRIVCRD